MNKKSTRTYSTGILAALSHPLRVSIYELIQKGAKTTIELEKILNENRVNLYHHLNVLEKAGLIQSYFGQDRLKKFKMKEEQVSQKTKLVLNISEDNVAEKLTETNSVVVIPTTKNQKKFNSKVKELLELSGRTFDKSIYIQQVQVIYQHKKISEIKESQLKQMQKESKS
ncbi:MAG: winged helix-turn-helix transcriptional regulator [Candidatus Heimdallarchaeota archaeon]|nr:winged helix-turn-helix transcriptional regulator [Candidatus Heimdallarchaeota archaeon]